MIAQRHEGDGLGVPARHLGAEDRRRIALGRVVRQLRTMGAAVLPFAAAMVPVIRGVAESTSANMLNPMAFTLALGADIGGNATPIGASANVVGLAVAEKHDIKVTWKDYCKVAFPAMIISMIIINVLILVFFA